MDRPILFYHASLLTDLTDLVPMLGKRPPDFIQEPVVWATPSLAFASEFLVNPDGVVAKGGAFGEICYLVIADKKKYTSIDRGGAIYVLPPSTFSYYKGYEWYSTVPVTPINKIIYSSALQAMLENGVQVYFTDPDTFSRLELGEDHLSIVRKLKSENEKLNINYMKL